jgi:LSD1 subclass zinc finger protein
MSEEPAIRQTQCPSCGAPIAWPEGESSMRCPYCNVGLERTLPQQEDNDTNTVPIIQPQIVIQTSSFSLPAERVAKTAVTTAGAAACSSAAIGIFILVVVGAILAGIFLLDPNSPVSLNPRPLQVHDPFVLIPGTAEGPADVIAMSYDIKAETYAIGRLSVAKKKFLWRATPVDSISDVRLAANETTVFLVEKDTQLKALKHEDGSLLWQAELVDKLGYGDTSLTVQDNRVVVLTQDYTLQAFDAVTGAEAWSRRLSGSVAGYTLLTQNMAVIDTVDEKTSLFLLRLSDGSEVKRFTPVCEQPDYPGWESGIYSSSVVYFTPGEDGRLDSGAVYFLYGYSPTCVERWDIPGGNLAWRSVDMESSIPSTNDTLMLVTPEMVFYGYDDQLWAIVQATSERKLLLESEDYEPLPLAMANGSLLVRARRTRGSERFELWRINTVTGERTWSYNMGESKPFQPPDEQVGSFSSGDSAWDWRLEGDQLVLFKAATDPNQFVVETLELSDGTVTQTYSTPIKTWSEGSYWMDRGLWQGPLYWVVTETKLFVLNTNTGVMQYSYP